MNEYTKRFSIIMVALNAEEYILNALKSIEGQTYHDYEVILIDGLSTDNTLSLVRDSKVSNMKIISESDAGIYDAMNKGVKHSAGEYLYFLNADDSFVSNETLESVNQRLENEGDPEILYGDIIKVFRDKHEYIKFPAKLDRLFFVRKTICHQAIFAKNELFERYGGFSLRYPVCADYVWLADMFLNKSINPKYYNHPVCNYYAYGVSSFSSSISENYLAAREYFSIFELLKHRYLKWWMKRIKRVLRLSIENIS